MVLDDWELCIIGINPDLEPHLVDVELALSAGQLPVAGGELPNEVMAAKKGSCWDQEARAMLCLCLFTTLPLTSPGSQFCTGLFSRGTHQQRGCVPGRSPVLPTEQETQRSSSKEQGPREWDPFLLGFLFE